MRRRFNYANVTATLALVFAMSGGALAAHHYLISSTKQISPKVLAALRSRAGPTGPSGPRGTTGTAGTSGELAATPATLPSGHSESGTYSVASSEGGYLTEGITFPIPLASALGETRVAWLAHSAAPTETCPGPGRAAAGYLCVYEQLGEFRKPDASISAVSTQLGRAGSNAYGFIVFLDGEGEKLSYSYGSWTVTAP
jgi:hypothetical protein